jgi:hypothetical protein
MSKGHLYPHLCTVCGQEYVSTQSPSVQSKRCPACHEAFMNQKKCVICGQPSGRSKTCGAKCQLALRRLNKQRLKDNAEDKRKKTGITRCCLKCGEKFKAIGRYNRICEPCTLSNQRHYQAAGYWGSVI